MKPVFISFMVAVLTVFFSFCGQNPEASEHPKKLSFGADLAHSPDHARVVNYYYAMQISLDYLPGEKFSKEPAYQAKNPRYGTITIGNGPDNKISIAVDEVKGEGILNVYIDQNNDEDLTNDQPPQLKRRPDGSTSFGAVVLVNYSTPDGKKDAPYRLFFYTIPQKYPDKIFYFRDEFRHGEISLGKKSYKLAVFDDNADGLFNDLPNGAFFIDLDGDGKIGGGNDSHEYYKCTEPFTVGGMTYQVAEINPTGTKIVIETCETKIPEKAILLPGHAAVNFTGTDLAGNKISLSDYRGKVVLLDFWATWCRGCVEEIPNIKNIYDKYKDSGFVVIGISLDMNRRNLEAFIRNAEITWPQIHDGQGWESEISRRYRVTTIPNSFLLDKDGIIRNMALRGPSLEEAVHALLTPPVKEGVKVNPTAPAGAKP